MLDGTRRALLSQWINVITRHPPWGGGLLWSIAETEKSSIYCRNGAIFAFYLLLRRSNLLSDAETKYFSITGTDLSFCCWWNGAIFYIVRKRSNLLYISETEQCFYSSFLFIAVTELSFSFCWDEVIFYLCCSSVAETEQSFICCWDSIFSSIAEIALFYQELRQHRI